MEQDKHDAERLQEALHNCPALSAKLGLQGLACLAACSRSLKDACCYKTCLNALGLLDTLLLLEKNTQLSEQHKQAATWLVKLLHRVANKATIAGVAGRLTLVPSIGIDVALQLVAAGMHITFAQLLAAADSMVAGVEVWVQAQKELKVKSDIPQAAYTVCCSSKWVSGTALLSGEARGNTLYEHLVELAYPYAPLYC
jgi:hypothetical protein